MNFDEMLAVKTQKAEAVLKKYLPREEGFGKELLEAINYSALAGGKRLRPILMEECYRLFGGEGNTIEPFMAAIEMIHNYSLVHDDLPAMDNDEYRRGRQTTWKVYGDGIAVLAGDGLLNLAFETAGEAFEAAKGAEEVTRVAKSLQILSQKAGIHGMIGGQAADLEAEKSNHVTKELLLYIHENKTAALIQASMMIGSVLAGAKESEVREIEKAAYDIGVAFQIQDDILDIISTDEILGKPTGSDVRNNKLTYVTLHGLEESTKEVRKLSEEAMKILESFQGKNPFLLELVASLINREK